ncbi:MAG: transposase [Desulfuromonas sp. SDB]|nr:MAG: transposase [Desulfuromonas sp. SDB]
MRRKRFTLSQKFIILREGESGIKIIDLVKKHGISEQTFYRWRNKYGNMNISEAKRLKVIEEENSRLKRKVAELLLENDILREFNSKKW